MVWAALFGHARIGLHGGAEACAQPEHPLLRTDDAESAAPPPKEPEEPAVQKEKIIVDPHPKTATESPSPAKPVPLEPADDFQLVGRDGSVPPMASEAPLRMNPAGVLQHPSGRRLRELDKALFTAVMRENLPELGQARARATLSAEAQKALDGQLWEAARDGDIVAIERLAAEGASPNAKGGWQNGVPAVYTAALKGHAGAVSALARLGADLDARTSASGYTALMNAIMGEVEVVRALLDAGADRTLRATGGVYEGKTALEIAEAYASEAEVAALLRSPAEQAAFEAAFEQALSPDARAGARAALSAKAQKALDGQLWDAAMKGDAAAIERLAAEGASPSAKSEYYEEPAVAAAALNGHAGAVLALARLGAELDARGKRGFTALMAITALMAAAAAGQVECARALLAGGADRTLRATGGYWDGKTALEMAEQYGRAEYEGKTALEIAEARGGAISVVALLRGVSVAEVRRALPSLAQARFSRDEYAILDAMDQAQAALESEARKALESDEELAARQKRFAEVVALLRE